MTADMPKPDMPKPDRRARLRHRDLLIPAGVCLIGAGVATCVWTGLGAGPVDVLLTALAERAGGSFALVTAPLLLLLATGAVLLGGRPGPATVLAPLMVGPVIDTTLALLGRVERPASIVALVSVHLAATAAMGAGGAAILLGRRGPAVLELLAGAIAGRFKLSETLGRTVLEGTMLTLGWLLGGPVGAGTVIVAAGVGPALRVSDQLAGRVRLTR